MQKSKLGISVGLLGAIACFSALFGSYIATFAVVGYILLCESNEWLRKISVKVVVLMIAFSVMPAVIGLIPDAIGLVSSLLNVFGSSFSIPFVSSIVSFLVNVINILEKLVFLILGMKALNQGNVGVGPIDGIVDKHFLGGKEEPAKTTAKSEQ